MGVAMIRQSTALISTKTWLRRAPLKLYSFKSKPASPRIFICLASVVESESNIMLTLHSRSGTKIILILRGYIRFGESV